MRYLLIFEKFGDLGNRLFRFARLLCVADNRDFKVIDLSFFQYAYLYQPRLPAYRFSFFLLRLLSNERLKQIEKFFRERFQGACPINLEPDDGFISESKFVEQTIQAKGKILLMNSWSFFVRPNTCEAYQKEKLRNIFRLKPRYLREAENILRLHRCDSHFLVGVHIRHGDYKTFEGGRHYFDEETYASVIRQLMSESIDGKYAKFIVISQGELKKAAFAGLPVYLCGPQPVGVDQAILQKCERILGVQSTFSAWPSFLHDIPHGVISGESCKLAWKDFYPKGVNPFPD